MTGVIIKMNESFERAIRRFVAAAQCPAKPKAKSKKVKLDETLPGNHW